MFSLLTLVTVLSYLTTFILAADTASWKSRSIYFVLTDRISQNGTDPAGSSCADLTNYCGGTFKGLESKLGYIKGLGFDAIWITPVVANSPGGYHGYWAQDLYAVNPSYGTPADLKSLVKAAQAQGIYVMVDVVVNHMGNGPITGNLPAPLNQQSSYHPKCEINYTNQTSVENCWISGLPDVNTQNPTIRSFYQTWVKWLVKEYGFDGVRIDTVKHVEIDFWKPFADAAGVYAIGEVFSGDPAFVANYTKQLPGVLNYPVYYPLNKFYQQQNGTSQALVDMLNLINSTVPDPTTLGTFIDNHDNPRWLNQKNDQVLLKNALAFVILSRGIPIVYYGTEQGFSGGADPANREDLWRSGYNTQTPLYRAIAKLNSARKNAGGLNGNDLVHLYVEKSAYAWSRAGGKLIVLTTNSGGGFTGQHCFNTLKASSQWTDVYGNATVVKSDASGKVCVQVTNGEPVVLLQAAAAAATNYL